jgi:hypothetical protein
MSKSVEFIILDNHAGQNLPQIFLQIRKLIIGQLSCNLSFNP